VAQLRGEPRHGLARAEDAQHVDLSAAEYFVPPEGFLPFARKMAGILKDRQVNALNVSIRHSPADTVSLMRWAREEVFAFVLYYKQRSHAAASTERGLDARADRRVLENGGRYYLPYRLDATREQFRRAYPEATEFSALRRASIRRAVPESAVDTYL